MNDILSIYNFRKVGSETNENDNFVRGQPELLKNIRRPGFFMKREDMIDQINILAKEKEELLTMLGKQDLQIKQLKHRLHHIGICRL
ncbi:unnamed protein product [Eruca vesicaria subsp. sativa]|uniref:Uncharacterized protein n=1 Tax=Eruca vesicaria subsp. sativa TaxID=29727 RepID=A0ABC8LCB5_ERUVS|nr:unnamed protein product [Eruca vesicaria subsp. sativa]